MFFDEITLKRNSWHYKLQGITLGKHRPDLWSFCPYFWLTIFCMIISPFTAIVWVFFILPFQAYDKFIIMPIFTKWVESLDDSYAAEFSSEYDDYNYYKNTLDGAPWLVNKSTLQKAEIALEILLKKKGIKKFIDEGAGVLSAEYIMFMENARIKRRERLSKFYDELDIENMKKRKIKEERLVQKEHVNEIFQKVISKLTVTKVVIWTKRIVTWAFSILIALSIFKLAVLLYKHFEIHSFLKFMKALSAGLGMLLGICIMTWLCIKCIKYLVSKMKIGNSFETFRISFITIRKISIWVFKLIISPFKFFISYFKAVKNDNCPAIKWEE